ncbi:MAG: hypothetical protein ACFE9S_07145 [Candidatus Hermodarchaeota archaeon]
MFKNLIDYFEQNPEDLSILVSKFIILLMRNFDQFKDKQLLYDLLDLARNFIKPEKLDKYNRQGQDCKYLSKEDNHDIREILLSEFIPN